MPEQGWFSPRAHRETLTSDDPPVRPARRSFRVARVLHRPTVTGVTGVSGVSGERLAGLRRAWSTLRTPSTASGAPRQDGMRARPDRTGARPGLTGARQLVGIWAGGAAVVAATGLAVAAVVGGAPAVVARQIDRLSVLPGPDRGTADPNPTGTPDPAAVPTDGTPRSRPASVTGSRLVPGVPAGASLPTGVAVPSAGPSATVAGPAPSRTGSARPAPAGSSPAAGPTAGPTAGSTATTPAGPTATTPVEPTVPSVPPAEVTTPPTESTPPVEPPTDPPIEQPTDDNPPPGGHAPSIPAP